MQISCLEEERRRVDGLRGRAAANSKKREEFTEQGCRTVA